jgi:glucose/arabinose dehydrogenase
VSPERKHRLIAAISLVLALVAAGCGGSDEPPAGSGGSGREGEGNARSAETDGRRGASIAELQAGGSTVEVTVIADGLEVPWGLAFLPGGDALVTERDSGRLLRLDPASGGTEEIQTLPTEPSGEGGSLGLAVSPDYRRDGLVYAYYTTAEDNRVVRFRLGEEPQPVLTGIPANTIHDGGRLAFGPDGMLYVATGDAGDSSNAQDRDSLGGKILRLTPDGDAPDDNPFPGSPVYSLGHRNVQGLTWDTDGRLYASEFGQDSFDEVNLIEAGENYGWPEIEGEGGTEQGYRDPITTWTTDEASPSGAQVLVDAAIPGWEGDLFVAALRGERLWRLELGGGEVAGREELLGGELGRIRNAVQAPDGSLWLTTSNRDQYGSPVSDQDDRIVRLAPAG